MPAGTRLHTVTSLHMLDYTIRTSCAAKHRLKSANGKYSRYEKNKQVIDLIFSLKPNLSRPMLELELELKKCSPMITRPLKPLITNTQTHFT
jgi:hypothetical protein